MKRRYFTLDVFTDTALSGNPLAVILDASGLSDSAMQAIGREFNLSETVFVFPPSDERQRARLRIFTPGMEMPFAGHPTIGTAVLLASLAGGSKSANYSFGLEENIGIVRCAVTISDSGNYCQFEVPVLPAEVDGSADTALIAKAIGLDTAEIGFDRHCPSTYSCGFPFTFVPVDGLAAIGRAVANLPLWHLAFGQGGLGAAYLYTRETVEATSQFHARMFSPGDGIPEDAATGSAAAALAGVIARYDRPADGVHAFRIEQGFEMGRRSFLDLTMTMAAGKLSSTAMGGKAVIFSEGELRL
jgi:trans-2,3-dihydro-3-hydroxyanthranilate isomerase